MDSLIEGSPTRHNSSLLGELKDFDPFGKAHTHETCRKCERRHARKQAQRGKFAALRVCLKWMLCVVFLLFLSLGLFSFRVTVLARFKFLSPYTCYFFEKLKMLATVAKFAADMAYYYLSESI
jgi:hypothetical protein